MYYSYQFVRSIEELAIEVEQFCLRFFQNVTVNRHHHEEHSEIELIVMDDPLKQVEVSIDIDICAPINNRTFRDHVIDLFYRTANEGTTCRIFASLPNGTSYYYDEDGDLDYERGSPNSEFAKNFLSFDSEPPAEADQIETERTVSDPLIAGIEQLISDIPHSSLSAKIAQEINEWGLREISPLRLLGYVVGANGLNENQRQKFLGGFLSAKLPNVFPEDYIKEWGEPNSQLRCERTMSHLSGNIKRASQSNPDALKLAIAHWQKDLGYLKLLKVIFRGTNNR